MRSYRSVVRVFDIGRACVIGLVVRGVSSVLGISLVASHIVECAVVSRGVASILEERHGVDFLLSRMQLV